VVRLVSQISVISATEPAPVRY